MAKDQKARQKILAERTLHRNFLTQHFEILTARKWSILFPKSILSSAFGSGISAAGGGAMELWLGGGISGGLGSMIAGGNFVDGLRQGLIGGGLNHAAHAIQYNLTKNLLIRAAKNAGLCTICSDQEIGELFQNIVGRNLAKAGFEVTPGTMLETIFGNTIPDFYIGLKGDKSGKMFSFGGMVEVKAKMEGSGLSLSSQNGQLFKQIWAHSIAWQNGRGTHTIVTTAGVKVSPTVRIFASGLGISSSHFYSTYTGRLDISTISFSKKY